MDSENNNANNLLDNDRVYRISLPFLDVLDERLEKLNKKAKKLGVDPVSYEVVGEEFEEEDDYVKVFKLVRVFGSAPVLNGWRFECKIEHNDGFNVLYPSPDCELNLTKYADCDSVCDHCGHNRQRNNTYIVSNVETCEVVQVGSSCLKDFLGHASPQAIADWVEFLQGFEWDLESSDNDMDFWGGGGVRYYFASEYLSKVAAVVRKVGWVSRASANYYHAATADTAWVWMTGSAKEQDSFERDGFAVTEADVELAEFAMEYARNLTDDQVDGNSYLLNLRTLSQNDFVNWKSNGLVASMIVTAMRAREREINRVKFTNLKETSEYVGAIKDRIDVEVTVTSLKFIDGYYGATYLFNMTDGKNCFVWFASNEVLEVEKKYLLKGTIKAHDEYNGLKQTVLTRCKVLLEIAEDD